MESKRCVVIGSGIVGLHLAQALLSQGHEVYVLDQEPYLGEHTSSRNSGVIHSGVFYKTGSLKERLCIEGNVLTYEWLKKLKVPHKKCGKWVVPDEGQENLVAEFFSKISKLPIESPTIKSAKEIAIEEPLLKASLAILIPSTGILDAAIYLKSLSNFVELNGGQIILNCCVEDISKHLVHTTRGALPFDLLFNCAGLFADQIALMDQVEGYSIRPCRGDYYCISKAPISRPIYHIPSLNDKGLGVHLTPTIDGSLLIGPNAFFIEKKTDYHHCSNEKEFKKSVEYYLPEWKYPLLAPAYSGNRPKLYFNGELKKEFEIIRTKNGVHLLGIESPGLTAAPSLAQHIIQLIQ